MANAGIVPGPGPVLDCPPAVWAEVLQTNLALYIATLPSRGPTGQVFSLAGRLL